MNLSPFELLEISVAIIAVMMLGTRHIRTNLLLYSAQTAAVALVTGCIGFARAEQFLYTEAIIVFFVKALFVPWFLSRIMKRVGIESDSGTYLSSPLCMHAGIVLLGVSYLLARKLPTLSMDPIANLGSGSGLQAVDPISIGGAASLALIFMGMMLMLTRKIAVNQVIGFLVIENGIYTFSLTQTTGMPMIVEMGILLDVLGGVMIAGLLLFRIKKSFEHIDVTLLTELKD